MGYVIFSFEDGDYLCDRDRILVFSSKGLAFQYLREYRCQSVPIQKTKRFIHYPDYYHAPFRVQKVC